MIPVAFNDCAGILHPAEGGSACDLAVVVCEPFGYEALCTQRAMLTLARMLAAAGITTLRFHYPGTGDSAGEETPGQIDRWIDAIGGAATYLQDASGATHIALCGFRLGGLLAIEAAARFGTIDALALLAPVLSGRLYARELILSGAMIASRGGTVPAGWREILGYRLHQGDLERLRQIDRTATRGAGVAPRVLLVSPEPAPEPLAPGETYRPFQHYDGLIQHTQDVVLPLAVFRETVAWLREGVPARAGGRPAPPQPARLDLGPEGSETPVRFGAGDRCFGILTQPAAAPAEEAVLIVNSGLNAHTGNGRGAVRLGRRLAARGITALRIDMDRIGESAPDDPHASVGFHDLGRVADVRAAIDLLQRAGHHRVLLTGLCAGAYIGLHAAAADPRVRAAVLVNLPYFYIREEDPAVPLWRRPLALARRLRDYARRWGLSGARPARPLLGPAYFRRRYLIGRGLLLLHYAGLTLGMRTRALLGRLVPRPWVAGPPDRLLQKVRQNKVDLTLVYSSGDWGLVELEIVFGKDGERLLSNDWGAIRIIDGADHTFTTAWMQDVYAGIVEQQLGLAPEPAADPAAETTPWLQTGAVPVPPAP